MKNDSSEKVFRDYTQAVIQVKHWKDLGQEVVFTNGCFDLFHRGHLEVILKAADMGDKLVIGLNSDASIKKLKGKDRPIYKEDDRAIILASLSMVDMVVIFDEETPENLITSLLPDVLIKGSDYILEEIVGAEIVMEHGGEVKTIDLIEGYSTSKIIQKVKSIKQIVRNEE